MEKLFITNSNQQKLSVIVEKTKNQKGLAFIMHGLGGFKEQPHIATFAQAFKDAGYTVMRFDTTNTCGESDGKYENATTTNYYKDLEDVINWSKTQPWYQEPFCLAGHSLGGICIALYAENHPNKIKALAPISTVVSGKLSGETPKRKNTLKDWKKTGWEIHESSSQPSLIKKLPWSHMIDRIKYDLLPKVQNLKMPILMIVGDQDDSTPPEHQKILFKAIPHNNKELHIIKGAPHTFRDEKHLAEIKQIFDNWLTKIK